MKYRPASSPPPTDLQFLCPNSHRVSSHTLYETPQNNSDLIRIDSERSQGEEGEMSRRIWITEFAEEFSHSRSVSGRVMTARFS